MSFHGICNTPLPLSLAVCGANGVHMSDASASQACDLLVVQDDSRTVAPILTISNQGLCTFDLSGSEACSRCSLTSVVSGTCPASQQQFAAALNDVVSGESSEVIVIVTLDSLLAEVNVTLSLTVLSSEPMVQAEQASLGLNRLAAAASSVLSEAANDSSAPTVCQQAADGENIHVVLAPRGDVRLQSSSSEGTPEVSFTADAIVRLAVQRSEELPTPSDATVNQATACLAAVVQEQLMRDTLAGPFWAAAQSSDLVLQQLSAEVGVAVAAACPVLPPEVRMQLWLDTDLEDLVSQTHLVVQKQVRIPNLI